MRQSSQKPMQIALTEYQEQAFPQHTLTAAQIHILRSQYASQVDLSYSPFQDGQPWRLVNRGWAGYMPLDAAMGIELLPKVPIANVLRMLEVVYDLSNLQIPPGTFEATTLHEFYERMANIFARRVIDRCTRGIYRAYIGVHEELITVRGRVLMHEAMARPQRIALPCVYDDFTADLPENQILAFALQRIRQSGLCSEEHALPFVRKAGRLVAVHATPVTFTAVECLGRRYNRLNADYALLHALAHFFLSHTGPTIYEGNRATVPFLIPMARLFEVYVPRWLARRVSTLRQDLVIDEQFPFSLDAAAVIGFRIDGIIRNRANTQPQVVFDTKYQRPNAPSADDVAQAIAYAQVVGAPEAVLVYPAELQRHVDCMHNGIRVRSLSYVLADDLENQGRQFMDRLLER
jgi:5-methylcytosine-specific restriction enzyme subunit McrC